MNSAFEASSGTLGRGTTEDHGRIAHDFFVDLCIVIVLTVGRLV
jgi:hypothetical protein